MIRDPKIFLEILGSILPASSVYFADLIAVKFLVAVPAEMMRPYQLTTILSMSYFMDKRKVTRRELRTGAFYAWPMLYGWVYPQLMLVEMIMLTYSVISPVLMPFGIVFFLFTYAMYKYQLLWCYVNEFQSGGHMFYAVFNRSMVGILFASIVMIAYFGMDLSQSYHWGPFFFLMPLPVGLLYFWHYCDSLFSKKMVSYLSLLLQCTN
jgi:hypothetical protein